MNLQQQNAIEASGGILLAAGAGTGKTTTLVARCIRLVTEQKVDVDRILMVTFTNAAAAEMRQRLREALHKKLDSQPGDDQLLRQVSLLEGASICTIHSFCAELIRSHFEELGLDPAVGVLDDSVASPLAAETALQVVRAAIAVDGAARQLASGYCNNSPDTLAELVRRTHEFFVAQPRAAACLDVERKRFECAEAAHWKQLRDEAALDWIQDWKPTLLEQISKTLDGFSTLTFGKKNTEDPITLARLSTLLREFQQQLATADTSPPSAAALFAAILKIADDTLWVRGTKQHQGSLKKLFKEAAELRGWQPRNGVDPLDADWQRARLPVLALLGLARQFAEAFGRAKRALGGVDFSDLEQFALQLLTNDDGSATEIATQWRARLDHVFVDECQDINAAQDAIIRAVSREGARRNLFMVGDVKQSIYRFRMAAPELFRDCAQSWKQLPNHQVLPLTENFRSRESILHFVNDLFATLMQPAPGGVSYGPDEQLQFGAAPERNALSSAPANEHSPGGIWSEGGCRVELHLVNSAEPEEAASGEPDAGDWEELLKMEREARIIAARLEELKTGGHQVWDKEGKYFRPMKWSDVGILMRSPRGRTEPFLREFRRLEIPLSVEQGSFLETTEASDLVALLRLLDNPQQDIPLFAVLRSPLAGLTLDELVQIRRHTKDSSAWNQLKSWAATPDGSRAAEFVSRFERWRKLALMTSLTCVLEEVLAATRYEAFLLTLDDGEERVANVRRFLDLARRYDPLQRQGLFRFLQFIDALTESGREIEPVPPRQSESARIISIHKSKGLEFPVVVLANISGRFNASDLGNNILFTRRLGVAPMVADIAEKRRYDSPASWLARRAEKNESVAEELRLLYVALTRARDTLILCGTFNPLSKSQADKQSVPLHHRIKSAGNYCDWILAWLGDDVDWTTGDGVKQFFNKPGSLRWRVYPINAPVLSASASAEANAVLPAAAPAGPWARDRGEYPHSAATSESAKTSATALKRLAAADEEASQPWRARFEFERPTALPGGKLSAAERGVAHHTFLELADFGSVQSEAALTAEAQRLTAAGALTADEAAVLDIPAIAGFWATETGRALLEHKTELRRELEFTAAFTPSRLRQLTGATLKSEDSEYIIVQGVADLVRIGSDEIRIVDFKTDRFDIGDLAAKTKEYTPQLRLYADALERIYKKPVTRRCLYFLHCSKLVDVPVMC